MNFEEYTTALIQKNFDHMNIYDLTLDDFNELYIPKPKVFYPHLLKPRHYSELFLNHKGKKEYRHSHIIEYLEVLPIVEQQKLLTWWAAQDLPSALFFMLNKNYIHGLMDIVLPFLREYKEHYDFDNVDFFLKIEIEPQSIEKFFLKENIRARFILQNLTIEQYEKIKQHAHHQIQNNVYSFSELIALKHKYKDPFITQYIHDNRFYLFKNLRDNEQKNLHKNDDFLKVFIHDIPFEHRELLFYTKILGCNLHYAITDDHSRKKVSSFKSFYNDILDTLWLIPEKEGAILNAIKDIYKQHKNTNHYFYRIFLNKMPCQTTFEDPFKKRLETERAIQNIAPNTNSRIDFDSFFYETFLPWDKNVSFSAEMDVHL